MKCEIYNDSMQNWKKLFISEYKMPDDFIPYAYMSKDMTLEEFGEYLNSPRKGDSFKVLGTRIEIKDVD